MKFDHDYHIHSVLSECSSDPAETSERILEYAKRFGLKRICVTDHFWDEAVDGASDWYKAQNLAHISQIKPLPECEGIEFLFGCETDIDKYMTLGISLPCFDNFDFVIIPTTHLHMTGFTISAEDKGDNQRIAELWIERFDRLLDMPLPFHKIGIAHLACTLINNRSHEDYLDSLSRIPDEDMVRLFTKAARCGCGIEINAFDVDVKDDEVDTVYRMFRIAKSCGCKFYYGSDAHHPSELESSAPKFERAARLLGLTDNDRFEIRR